MIDNLTIRNMTTGIQKVYIRAVKNFSLFSQQHVFPEEGERVWLIVSASFGPKGVCPPAPRFWRRVVRCPW
jgi:hypothetical protein